MRPTYLASLAHRDARRAHALRYRVPRWQTGLNRPISAHIGGINLPHCPIYLHQWSRELPIGD